MRIAPIDHGVRGRLHRRIGGMVLAAMAVTPLVGIDLVSDAGTAGAATAAPIRVYDICSCTGPLAATAKQTTPTLQAWTSSVNAKGGLNGHKVILTVADDQTSPAIAIADIQRAIQVQHVAAIFDNSNVDTNWAAIATKAGVPIIGGSDSDLSYNNLDTFTPGPTLNYGITGQMIAVSHLTSETKEAIFYCVEAAVCSSETAVASIVGPRYGIKLVYKTGISFSAPNYAAACLAAKSAGAKVIEVADAAQIQEKAASDCAKQGWTPIQVASTTSSSMATNKLFNGMISSQQNIPYFVHNGATKSYWSALNKYAPTLKSDPNFGEQSIIAWVMGPLLQDAVKAAAPSSTQTVTPAIVKKGLYSLPANDNLGGMAPQAIKFVKGQYSNRSCWFYLSVKNGKFIWSNNQKPLCGYLIKAGSNEGSPLLKPKQQYVPAEKPTR